MSTLFIPSHYTKSAWATSDKRMGIGNPEEALRGYWAMLGDTMIQLRK